MNTSSIVLPGEKSKGFNISLWIAQILLAAMFLLTGSMKLIKGPMDGLPAGLVYFIGTAELLGAIGLLLPSLTRIKPQLTPWAATGLGTIMILATIFHISRGQVNVIGIVLFLAALAFFVAWGRFKKVPVPPKN